VKRLGAVGVVAIVVCVGCAAGVPGRKLASSTAARTVAPDVELFFKGDQPWARRGAQEWSLGDVRRQEMVFAPDGKRFAYVRQKAQAANGRGTVATAHVLVRNLAGDPVNDFPVYRPGAPAALTWLDNRRIGYLAPPEPGRRASSLYVIHDADTGEVLAARSGADFVWDGQHRHVAFLTGRPGQQALVVDGKNVWPRAGTTRLHGDPVWSADGHGVAIVDAGNGAPRLVVLVEYDDPAGDLTWPVPRDALAPGLRVYWASESKVVIGESALKPKFAAGWERLQ
jgi:hypothetical protein